MSKYRNCKRVRSIMFSIKSYVGLSGYSGKVLNIGLMSPLLWLCLFSTPSYSNATEGKGVVIEATLKLVDILDAVSIAEYKEPSSLKTKSGSLGGAVERLLSDFNEFENDLVFYYDNKINSKNRQSKRLKLSFEKQKKHYVDSKAKLNVMAKEFLLSSNKKTFEKRRSTLRGFLLTLTKAQTKASWDQEGLPFGPQGVVARRPASTNKQLVDNLEVSPAEELAPPTNLDLLLTKNAPNSEDVETLAGELGGSPADIYSWVYNNITFVPSFGAVQGGDMTLQIRRGNATDISSLLIALLRSSGVSARYRYGVVDLEVEDAMNWVGGVNKVASAVNLIGQGGIPSELIRVNGIDTFIRIEHTWVQMWNGVAWIDLDASIKQYIYSDGIDYTTEVPLDFEQFSEQVQFGVSIVDSEQSIQDIDPVRLKEEISLYANRVSQYTSNLNGATSVTDLLGGQRIVQYDLDELPVGLKVDKIIASTIFSDIPDVLRHKFRVEMKSESGAELLAYESDTVDLAGNNIALSFQPASEADLSDFSNYMAVDTLKSVYDLPSVMPVGLFNVSPQFRIADELIEFSGVVGIGQEVVVHKGYIEPYSSWNSSSGPMVAGESQVIGISLQGESSSQFEAITKKIEDYGRAISVEDHNFLAKNSIFGPVMELALLTYFSDLHARVTLHSQLFDVVSFSQPSYGTLSTNAVVSYNFGIPENYYISGFLMDMDRLGFNSECKSNCWNKWYQFNRDVGALSSAYEHEVVERSLSALPGHAYGVSTIKALDVAMANGQKIFRIEQSNWNEVRSLLSSDISASLIEEFDTAIENGSEILTHESPIEVSGWTGVGYMVIDPNTGAGAYKISGGSNGAAVEAILDADFSSRSDRCPYPRTISGPSAFNGAFGTTITINSQLNDNLRDIFSVATEMILAFFPTYDSSGNLKSKSDLVKVAEKSKELSETINRFVFDSEEGRYLPIAEQEFLILASNGAQALNTIATSLFDNGIAGSVTKKSSYMSLAMGSAIGAFIAPYLYATLVNHCRL